MDGSVQKEHGGCHSGGILSLAATIQAHRKAVEYDLVTLTGFQLDDIGRGLSWSALGAVLENVPPESALMRELHPEMSTWGTRAKTNAILADIFDLLANINYNLRAIGGDKPKRPKPYPRPFRRAKDDENVRHIGRGALPPDELRKWFEEKRKKYAGSSKRDHRGDSGPAGGTAVTD